MDVALYDNLFNMLSVSEEFGALNFPFLNGQEPCIKTEESQDQMRYRQWYSFTSSLMTSLFPSNSGWLEIDRMTSRIFRCIASTPNINTNDHSRVSTPCVDIGGLCVEEATDAREDVKSEEISGSGNVDENAKNEGKARKKKKKRKQREKNKELKQNDLKENRKGNAKGCGMESKNTSDNESLHDIDSILSYINGNNDENNSLRSKKKKKKKNVTKNEDNGEPTNHAAVNESVDQPEPSVRHDVSTANFFPLQVMPEGKLTRQTIEAPQDDKTSQNKRKKHPQPIAVDEKEFLNHCVRCGTKSPNCMVCQRCHLARYCGRECKSKDAKRHKETCLRIFAFNTAKTACETFFRQPGNFLKICIRNPISFFLGSIPDYTRYTTIGCQVPVLLEILEAGVGTDAQNWLLSVRDVSNMTANITIPTKERNFPLKLAINKLVAADLQKGTFILLVEAVWTVGGLGGNCEICLEEAGQFYLFPGVNMKKSDQKYDWSEFIEQ
ncbi:hypothetical protein PoB_006656300 [Plakobranchus ocellatus]|uniref:MYND-type domain-containing protein n=1 Tax=Plakobranchus ocellatus TaxID=259542 RepID=A0AAV4D7M5_9GAST|nr:hypothetical protein PoB_006656300 [Plakobranchus ocellatus]